MRRRYLRALSDMAVTGTMRSGSHRTDRRPTAPIESEITPREAASYKEPVR